jgi:hypothetical protein
VALTFIPATAASFCNGGSTTINLAFGSSGPTAGNMGVAWCFAANGNNPPSLSSSNGKDEWCPIVEMDSNVGVIKAFVCKSLTGGPTTVSGLWFCSPVGGTPSMHLQEYSYTGMAALMAVPPPAVAFNYDLFFAGITGSFQYQQYTSGAPSTFDIFILSALYDLSGNGHHWASSPGSVNGYTLESSGNTTASAMGDCGSISPGITFVDPYPPTQGLPINPLPIVSFLVVD